MLSYLKHKYVSYHLKSRVWADTAADKKRLSTALLHQASLEMMVETTAGTQRNLFNWAFETFPSLRLELWENLRHTLENSGWSQAEQMIFWEKKSTYWIDEKHWKQMNAWWNLCPTKNWSERLDFLHRMEKRILDKGQEERNFQVGHQLKHLYELFRNAPPRKYSWIVSSLLEVFPKVCDMYEKTWQVRQRAFPLQHREEKDLRRGRYLGEMFSDILKPYTLTQDNLVRGFGLFEQESATSASKSFRDSNLIQMAVTSFTLHSWEKVKETPYYRNTLTLSHLDNQLSPPYTPAIPTKEQPSFVLASIFEDKSSFYGQSPSQRERLRLQVTLRRADGHTIKPRI